jgi:hypothetical protein
MTGEVGSKKIDFNVGYTFFWDLVTAEIIDQQEDLLPLLFELQVPRF